MRLVKEVMGIEIEVMKILVDNQSAIMLRKTSAHHNRTKHINTPLPSCMRLRQRWGNCH